MTITVQWILCEVEAVKATGGYHLIPTMAITKKRTQVTNVGKDMEKREPSNAVVIVNWYSHYGQQSEISQKLKQNYHMTQQLGSPGYIPERNKNTNLKRQMFTPLFTAILLATHGHGKQPKYPQQMNG